MGIISTGSIPIEQLAIKMLKRLAALPIDTMTTSCVLYPQEKNHLSPVAEPWRNSRQTATQAPFIPNANLRTTLRDSTNVADNLSAEEALSLEIEELCMATLIIDQAFYDIGRRLSDTVKEQNARIDLYDTCRTLETHWSNHHQTYQNLLWRSREFAGEAQAAVDDFRELVLPSLRDKDTTRSEKEEIIQGQLKILQSISQPSQNLCQEFLDFGRVLDMYIADLSRVVEGLNIGEQSQKANALEDRLRSARAAMEAVSQEVKELGWKFAEDVATTGIALLLAFVVPTYWAKLADAVAIGISCKKAAHSGPPFFEARTRCDLAVAEYEKIKAEYDLERAYLGQMVKLESTLRDSRPLVQEVTMRLGIFASVWAAITADIRKLKGSLQQGEDVTSPLFIPRVRRLEKMYGHLSQALRLYQVMILPPMPGTLVPV